MKIIQNLPNTGNPPQQTPLSQMIHTTTEHKLAAIKYLTNRLLTYPIKDSEK
jgi:hypothetical protein